MRYPPATLRDRKDRMSLSSGLAVRVPSCDHRIGEPAYNLPWAFTAPDWRVHGIDLKTLAHELPQ